MALLIDGNVVQPAKKPTATLVDPSDRKLYLMGADRPGGKEALNNFDAALKTQQTRQAAAGGSPSAIRETQSQLNALGFDTGGVDGIAGAKTDQAIRDFQAANGLMVDGIVGPQTRKAMEEARNTALAPSVEGPSFPGSGSTEAWALADGSGASATGYAQIESPQPEQDVDDFTSSALQNHDFLDQPSPPRGSFPGIILPDDHLGPIESPVVENPDYPLSQYEEGYVDITGGGYHDGKLHLNGIRTQANSLFSEVDLGAYGPGGIDLPHAAVQGGDASNGGSAVRWEVGPGAAVPLAGADTSRNDNGEKVLEVFVPLPASSLTIQSEDPIGFVAEPLTWALPVDTSAIDALNITNIVTGGRWDPPTERIEGLTSALNPNSD
jgi:peptidoglycan hydrolase-like protein with peptidoglycan-binding domain